MSSGESEYSRSNRISSNSYLSQQYDMENEHQFKNEAEEVSILSPNNHELGTGSGTGIVIHQEEDQKRDSWHEEDDVKRRSITRVSINMGRPGSQQHSEIVELFDEEVEKAAAEEQPDQYPEEKITNYYGKEIAVGGDEPVGWRVPPADEIQQEEYRCPEPNSSIVPPPAAIADEQQKEGNRPQPVPPLAEESMPPEIKGKNINNLIAFFNGGAAGHSNKNNNDSPVKSNIRNPAAGKSTKFIELSQNYASK